MSTWKRLNREAMLEKIVSNGYKTSIPINSFSPSDYIAPKKFLTRKMKHELIDQITVRDKYIEALESKLHQTNSKLEATVDYMIVSQKIDMEKYHKDIDKHMRNKYMNSKTIL